MILRQKIASVNLRYSGFEHYDWLEKFEQPIIVLLSRLATFSWIFKIEPSVIIVNIYQWFIYWVWNQFDYISVNYRFLKGTSIINFYFYQFDNNSNKYSYW